jgi:predicted phage tail protein
MGAASAGSGSVVVRWTAPTHNGGSPILRYEIQVLSAGNGAQVGTVRTAAAAAAQLTVTGLTNGTAYRFRVRAVNAVGAGAQSALSMPATPTAVPAAPATVKASQGAKGGRLTAAVNWSQPTTTGGSRLTGYRITAQRLDSRGAATGSPILIIVGAGTHSTTFIAPAGVRTATRYRFTVQAVNAVGAGPGRTSFTTVR